MACPACGVLNAVNASACGSCGDALPLPAAPAAARAGPLAVARVRAVAVLDAAAAALLAALAAWLFGETRDLFLPMAMATWALLGVALVAPALFLVVAAIGTWRLRGWGVALTLGACALAALGGVAIVTQGESRAWPLVVVPLAAAFVLLLPATRAAWS